MNFIVEWVNDDRNFRRIVSALVVVLVSVVLYMVVSVVRRNTEFKKSTENTQNTTSLPPFLAQERDEEEDDTSLDKLLDTKNDPDILYGSTDKYDWTQTESEVEMFVKLNTLPDFQNLGAKNCKIAITSTSISILVNGNTLVKGDFPAKVISDDCTWQLEEPRSSDKRIWITLYKAVPTIRNQHWKSALKGDAEIDVAKLGPPVHGVDTSNPAAIKKAVQTVRAFI